MKCELCEYEWLPRVETPKACPRCKRRFDYNYAKYAATIRVLKPGFRQGDAQ